MGRSAWVVVAGIWLTAGPWCFAQTAPTTVKVSVPLAEVRSGPSLKFYNTNQLKQDAVIEVVREHDRDWLAIKPPPGSFSWINARHLKRQNPTTWEVVGDQSGSAPVRYGSNTLNELPTVESVKLPRGAQVVGIGDLYSAADGQWLPIEPPPGEIRYIPVSQVSRVVGPSMVAPSAGPAAVAGIIPAPAGSANFQPAPAAPAAAGSHPLWVQAQQAEQRGDLALAKGLYEKCAAEVAKTDNALYIQCLNRAEYLRQTAGLPASAPNPYSSPANVPSSGAEGRLAPTASQTVAQYPNGPRGMSAPDGSGQAWVGHLRVAGCCLDGRRAYLLQDAAGRPVSYVVPQPGVNLDALLNGNVRLTGTVIPAAPNRPSHVLVSRIEALR